MKVVILAGGRGTRLGEENGRPKPLVDIGDRPILWHIMSHCARFGLCDFVVAVGHRGEEIARWMLDTCVAGAGRLDLDLGAGRVTAHREPSQPQRPDWRVQVVDTGRDTSKLGRLRRVAALVDDQPFLLTYADGLTDLDLDALLRCHREAGALVTLTAVRPPARFGRLRLDGERVTAFAEKSGFEDDWINGGYLVCEPEIFERLGPEDDPDKRELEAQVLAGLAREGRLGAYRHRGFWQCMDTPAEAALLNELWRSGRAPWAP